MPDLFALADLRDPASFLIGARIPLTLAGSMATWQRYEWCTDRLLARLCSDGVWDERPEPYLGSYFIDLSNPDVARWCDRKIAEKIAIVNGATEAITWGEIRISRGGGWDVRWSGGSGTRLHNCGVEYLIDVPHGQYITQARAALLRALFGGAS